MTYRDYRNFGHTRLTAATLCVPFPIFMGCAIYLGVYIGLVR